jgi:ectoine hydroxylase-related dioxygenase (phytanoyl-CoA dioxygenase family)
LENFVATHESWRQLAHQIEEGNNNGYLPTLLSTIMGERMVLYKEKLNLKPRGGSGFAPHLDTPSLRIALGSQGPQTFCTIMVAIDDMTVGNGCLKVCKGSWSEENHVKVIEPDDDGNPDAGGRAGAIPLDVANALDFEPIICRAGTIVIFNGWAPHRSSLNQSAFSRRAVFFTYNPEQEGIVRELYYESMTRKRNGWRQTNEGKQKDYEGEMAALASVPK